MQTPRGSRPGPVESRDAPSRGPGAAETGAPLVMFLGDSLTAGLGLPQEQAYPALVGSRLEEAGEPVRVVNAGVSGDTTAGGLRRLDWLLQQRPDVLVVALGANDGLRGLPPEEAKRNLRAIVRRGREAGCEVVLCGMMIPTSYGRDYFREFAGIYPALARDMDVPFVPFLLDGVGGVPERNQPDGIHPTAEGQRRMAENLLPTLREALQRRASLPRR